MATGNDLTQTLIKKALAQTQAEEGALAKSQYDNRMRLEEAAAVPNPTGRDLGYKWNAGSSGGMVSQGIGNVMAALNAPAVRAEAQAASASAAEQEAFRRSQLGQAQSNRDRQHALQVAASGRADEQAKMLRQAGQQEAAKQEAADFTAANTAKYGLGAQRAVQTLQDEQQGVLSLIDQGLSAATPLLEISPDGKTVNLTAAGKADAEYAKAYRAAPDISKNLQEMQTAYEKDQLERAANTDKTDDYAMPVTLADYWKKMNLPSAQEDATHQSNVARIDANTDAALMSAVGEILDTPLGSSVTPSVRGKVGQFATDIARVDTQLEKLDKSPFDTLAKEIGAGEGEGGASVNSLREEMNRISGNVRGGNSLYASLSGAEQKYVLAQLLRDMIGVNDTGWRSGYDFHAGKWSDEVVRDQLPAYVDAFSVAKKAYGTTAQERAKAEQEKLKANLYHNLAKGESVINRN